MFDFLKSFPIDLDFKEMVYKILEKEMEKECIIKYENKKGEKTAELNGEIVPLILGLIALERQVLTSDKAKAIFETLKNIVGVEAEEE